MLPGAHLDKILGHLALTRVSASARKSGFYVLDPFCGDGAAAEQISAVLGVDSVYGIEPNRALGAIAKEVLHDVLTPCHIQDTLITRQSFGLVFVMIPLDVPSMPAVEIVNRVTPLLAPEGILVLVSSIAPYRITKNLPLTVDQLYDSPALYVIPRGLKDLDVVLFARKRPSPVSEQMARRDGRLCGMELAPYITSSALTPIGGVQPVRWRYGNPVGREECVREWTVPRTSRPNAFKKTGFSMEEKCAMLSTSPLGKHLHAVPQRRSYKPPLTPGRGHIGTILAAGILDGRIVDQNGRAHVVRGSSFKAQYQDYESTIESHDLETGVITRKERFSETPVTVLRCAMAWPEPCIRTFSNQPEEIFDA